MQKVKGVKVTRKVKIVKRKFCVKKDTFTIIAMNYNQEQLKSNYILLKTFINFDKRQFKTNQIKTRKMPKKREKMHHFRSKTH